MNNELGRKLTSLTLMAIMFAGGITIAGASFLPVAEMPEAIATHGSSSGTLSVSSTHIMGGAVLGITISDPSIGATDQQITPPSVRPWTVNSIDMTQMSDGTWQAYVVDHESAISLQGSFAGENSNDDGFEYGVLCDQGLGAQQGGVSLVDGFRRTRLLILLQTQASTKDLDKNMLVQQSGSSCSDTVEHQLDGGRGGQILMSVLENPAALNTNSGTGTNNSGNRNIFVNSTNGFTSAWPFIQAMNFSSSMATSYGGEEVSVRLWGSDRDYSISIDRTIVPDAAANSTNSN